MTHEEAIELLPWLVNGSLDDQQHDDVAAHAVSCVTCRRELEELEIMQQSIDVMGAQHEPPAPDMRRINARIDAQLQHGSPRRALAGLWRRFTGSRWQVAFAVQSVVLLAVAVVLLLPREPQPVFSTLSNPETLPAGQYLRVVFDPTIAQPEVDAILRANNLVVVAGPTERGVVTLRFEDDIGGARRDAVASELERDARVLFAQPVQGVE
jgi:TusA-related sulfurtransferase